VVLPDLVVPMVVQTLAKVVPVEQEELAAPMEMSVVQV